MTRTKSRTVSLLCPTMGVLVLAGSLIAGRPTLAAPTADRAATGATQTIADAMAVAPSNGSGAAATTTINVKVRAGVAARLHAERLSIGDGQTVADASASPLANLTTKRMFAGSADQGSTSVTDLSSAARLGDLDDWYTITVPAGTDPTELARTLSNDPRVETAYVAPRAFTASFDYTSRQVDPGAAPVGIGQAAAAKVAGGLGENVHIFDVEGNWNLKHEDLVAAGVEFLENGEFADNSSADDPTGNLDHGTAVLGELIGGNNGFGVTGIVPKAKVSVVNASTKAGPAIPQAIRLATAHAKAGDVILIEQQYDVSDDYDYVPVEYFQADYDAIKAAVAKGVIVVEAAANGHRLVGKDLDRVLTRPDSGAIMVGAGQIADCSQFGPGNVARSRAVFSNYGSTVDLQGPGECVVTTGYGDLAGNGTDNVEYTREFSGTSSASPVVTGAVAAISSIIEERTGRPATPSEVRALLVKTGTAQDGAVAGHIGPMPNLAKAIAALPATGGQGDQGGQGGQGVDKTAPTVTGLVSFPGVGYSIPTSGALPTTVAWGAKDASGINRYAVKVSTDGAAWADVTLKTVTTTKTTLDLMPGHTYRFVVAARDGAGNWSDWKMGPILHPSLDPDSDENLAYAGDWSRRAWSPATDGSVTATNTAGDTVTVDFTGRAIGWIASRGTTRGAAHLWLDGKDLGIVDLHSDTTQARAIVFATTVSTGENHELIIVAEGTIDLDGLAFID